MNIIELAFFALAVALTLVSGNYLVRWIGWWGAVPAVILGFGSVYLLILALDWLLPDRPPKDDKEPSKDIEP